MGEEVRAVAEGFGEGGLTAPATDGGVVARGEDLGDGRAAEVGGAGVVGVVEDAAGAVGGAGNARRFCRRRSFDCALLHPSEQARRGPRLRAPLGMTIGTAGKVGICQAEALVARGVGVAEDAGEEADGGVEDGGGGEFSAAEDVVADGELLVGEEVGDALVHALVATADEDDAVERGEAVRGGLGEGLALGGEEDDGLAGEVAGGLGGDSSN